ncbi:MAG TPA: response regulator transcription factor [Gaiellaceae bacterium]|nr:response regulator transcription factor [Gaiellaceae bacterium]
MAAIRVVLGEHDFLAREGISRALEAAEDIDLVEACGDLHSLRAAVERASPDVVLTDIRLPPTKTDEGIRLASELRSSHPEIGVVVLSRGPEPRYALMLFENGSDRRAYLLKERLRNQEELSHAVREVADGRSLVDMHVVDELLVARRHRGSSHLDNLTPREEEVLAMLAEGRSNHAIAEELLITKRGVERHISSIFAKLELGESEDVSRRVKAALVYLSDGAAGGSR